jgi:5'-3' exonuclease
MERILYIDGYNIFYQMYSRNTAKDSNAEPIGGYVGSINFLQKVIDKFKPNKVYYVFDGLSAGQRRKSLYPGYKDKRGRKHRSVNIKLGAGEIEETVSNEDYQMGLLINALKQLPVTILTIPYYEADDIITYLVSKNNAALNIICSTDKDYLQLVRENIYVWSPQQKVLYTPEEVRIKYNVIPENFPYYRAIIGDSSDKLKGIKGIGDKTLLKHIDFTTKPFIDIGDFWEQIDLLEENKTLLKLKENKKEMHLMYKLMVLEPDNVSLSARELIQQQEEEQQNKTFSKFAFKFFCSKNQLDSILGNFDSWVRPFMFVKN